MKRLNIFVLIAIFCLAFQWFAFSQPAAFAEDGLGETIDCTDVRVNYVDDPSLTQEERLRLMDKAFQESLDKFELCRSARELANFSGASAGNGTGTGDGNDAGTAAGDGAGAEGDSEGSGGANGDSKGRDGTKGESKGSAGEAGGMSMGESVASSAMSGTEAVKTTPPARGIEAAKQTGLQGSRNQNESSGSTKAQNMGLSNGKPPEDIPSAQNDDTLAAQIRYAAQTETDPEKKRQLWNEYRKYKGLPTK